MKKYLLALKRILYAIVGIGILCTYLLVFKHENELYDLWGRELFEAPFLLKMTFIYYYPGILWSFVDAVVLFVLLLLITLIPTDN